MKWLRASACVLLLPVNLAVWGQRTATTTLVVQVRPEAYVSPSHVSLAFPVAADGTTRSITIPVAAWVRALPGQRIRVLGRASGDVPDGSLTWSGVRTAATGGGGEAACTGGTLAASQDLVSGWGRSGTLTCSVTFALRPGLPPGNYSASVELSVRAE